MEKKELQKNLQIGRINKAKEEKGNNDSFDGLMRYCYKCPYQDRKHFSCNLSLRDQNRKLSCAEAFNIYLADKDEPKSINAELGILGEF